MKTAKLLMLFTVALLVGCGGGGGDNIGTVTNNVLQIKSVSFEPLPTTYSGTAVYTNNYQITLEYTGVIDTASTPGVTPLTLTLSNYSSGRLVKKTYPSYNGLSANKAVRFRTYEDIGNIARRSFYLTLTDKQGIDSNTFIYANAVPPIASPLDITTGTVTVTPSPNTFSNMSTLSIVPIIGAADFIPSMTFCTSAMNKAYSLYGKPDSVSTSESMYVAYTYYSANWRYYSKYDFNFSWQSNGNNPSCQFSANSPSSSSTSIPPIPISAVLLKRAFP